MSKQPCVYILASQRNGTLYIGVTSDLVKRGWQHRNELEEGFTQGYGVHHLVYFEMHEDMREAIVREATQEMEPRMEAALDRGIQS